MCCRSVFFVRFFLRFLSFPMIASYRSICTILLFVYNHTVPTIVEMWMSVSVILMP